MISGVFPLDVIVLDQLESKVGDTVYILGKLKKSVRLTQKYF